MKKYRGFEYTSEFMEDAEKLLKIDVTTLIDNYIDNSVSILDVRVGDKIYNINIENYVIHISLRLMKS